MSQHINRTGRTLDLPNLPENFKWEVCFYPQVPYSKPAFWRLSLIDPTGLIVGYGDVSTGDLLPAPEVFTEMGVNVLERFNAGPHSYIGVYTPVA